MLRTWITTQPIDPSRVLAEVGTEDDGAVLLFVGTVRRHNDGRAVSGLRYDSYAAMAEQVLRQIAEEAAARWEISRLAAVHRTGELGIGEVSVAIAVSSPHRAEGFAACRHVIEEIKQRLPVWKQERYLEGTEKWLEGAVPTLESPRE
jgi:molybdopterin synthase catalytic subunit